MASIVVVTLRSCTYTGTCSTAKTLTSHQTLTLKTTTTLSLLRVLQAVLAVTHPVAAQEPALLLHGIAKTVAIEVPITVVLLLLWVLPGYLPRVLAPTELLVLALEEEGEEDPVVQRMPQLSVRLTNSMPMVIDDHLAQGPEPIKCLGCVWVEY